MTVLPACLWNDLATRTRTTSVKARLLVVSFFLAALVPAVADDSTQLEIPRNLPVNAAQLARDYPLRPYGKGFPGTIRNRLSIRQVRQAVQQDEDGIVVDFSHVRRTLDGQQLVPRRIYGTAVLGPYPFEADETRYAYLRFRRESALDGGRAELDVGYLLEPKTNSEGWTNAGQAALRLQLFQAETGPDLALGTYDTFFMFRKDGDRMKLLPSIVEGPFVNRITSDDPTRCVVSLVTSQPVRATVSLDTGQEYPSRAESVRHEITLDGLRPDTDYRYQVTVGGIRTRAYRLHTAPRKGAASFRFAYGGDSREGHGLGLESHMGCNFLELERLAAAAYRRECRFLLQGGDLVNGYTTQADDYRTQFYGWKHAVRGFHHERPVYAAMGNHECLIYNFDNGSKCGIGIDRWPYDTESSEVIFAEELVLPANGPTPSSRQRPPYAETVYSFQYGSLKCIAVNNNYWISYAADKYGGAPEGYIMQDQLDWIKNQLHAAANDATVQYVVLFMQEPMLPNGGHLRDAMWYHGNNNIRAHTWDGRRLRREQKGIVQVRNELMEAVHANAKVAAVLGSDEHGYSKVLIDKHVPVGVPARDDGNGDGWINYHGQAGGDGKHERASPLSQLKHPVWYLVGGGFGAPYYARQSTPWNDYWTDSRQDSGRHFYYSSQANIFVFDVTPDNISVAIYSPYGEVIDRIDDLMQMGSERR